MSRENDKTYFCNRSCEFFPCHAHADRENFNCLFCYCPLYALDDRCGGNFVYTEKGIKDCSNCLIPHSPGGYDYVLENFHRITDMMTEHRD